MEPTGTIIFSTVGRQQYGFDIFSVEVLDSPFSKSTIERRLTHGSNSINFNGQFVDDEGTIVFVSEPTGYPRIYLARPGSSKQPKQLPSAPGSLFHDRPILRDDRLYFISAHQKPDSQFKSWSALYSTLVNGGEGDKITRVTPNGVADFSPAISRSGKLIAVASYGSRPWAGDFRELETEIVVFRASDPNTRTVVADRGGWPSWSGDRTIYFHRKAEDGWWSIYQVELPEDFNASGVTELSPPRRVTPSGLHAFTPASFNDGKRIAVATRRKGREIRHVEVFDVESEKFHPVTELLNPDFHHYNPFVSPGSTFLGYHRFRGESAQGAIQNLEPITSPEKGIQLLRIHGSFPAVSPDGKLIAFNSDSIVDGGVQVVKSDGSKKWTLIRGRTAFYNSWSQAENNVIFTTLGPIFAAPRSSVQIARITFDPLTLAADNGSSKVKVEVKILTKEETGNNAFPSSSPDGKFVVFRSGRSGHKNLYLMDAVSGEFEGGSIRRLTAGPWIDTMPSWSPDGKLIAFSSNRHRPDNGAVFSIYLIRPDGSNLRRVYVAGLEGSREADMERFNHVCFSPNGEWLLFAGNVGGVTAEPVASPNQFQPYGELYAVRLDGGGLRRLTWGAYENGTPTWHSNGSWMLDLEDEIGRLALEQQQVGDALKGEFDDPLWLKCDF
ncbi:hypothetical protein Dimus_016683 [Dionaea muscipula]